MSAHYDVVIVGGGVTGTALAYALSRFGSVGAMALIEKCGSVGQVNSHPLNNAQTSHDGGTETNYNLEHALEVKRAATALRNYAEQSSAVGLFNKTTRMVLAVGADEVRKLIERDQEFGSHYPDLRLIGAEELRVLEPKVMEGRDPNQPVAALVSDLGYAVNYQRLAECFVEDAKKANPSLSLHLGTSVHSVQRDGNGGFVLETTAGPMTAKVIVFAAGAYSLHFAHMLGIGNNLTILPVAGSFFSSGNFLNGKVYRVQIEGMPFAAIHGDPDVLNTKDTRFGPTTKPVPLMERYHWETFGDFMKMGWVSMRGFLSLMRILANRQLLGYVAKNWLYDLPILGTLLFLKEAQEIVPSLRYRDLHLRKGAGGVRPQIVDLTTRELIMGDKTLVAPGVICNTTPSPGASVCLANAARDAPHVVAMLGSTASFDMEAFERAHGLE